MKRLCFLAVLMVLSSSAYAGRSISFRVGSHRVHIESSRHCRSVSCASMSISEGSTGAAGATAMTRSRHGCAGKALRHQRRRRSRRPHRRRPRRRPRPSSPPPPPAVYTTAASRSQIVAAPPPSPLHRRRFKSFDSSAAAAPPVEKPVETAQPAPPVERVSHRGRGRAGRFADRRLADRRQGNGADRKMRQCAVRLCPQAPRTRRARRC